MSNAAKKFKATSLSKLEKARREKTLQHRIDCGVSECLNICSEMQRLLPRELRDMVYKALFGHVVFCYEYCSEYDGSSSSYGPWNLYNVERVGQKTYAELAESWYIGCDFIVYWATYVKKLFTDNLWGLVHMEPRQFIRNVRLQIEYNRCHSEHIHLPLDYERLPCLSKLATFTVEVKLRNWSYHVETQWFDPREAQEVQQMSVAELPNRVFPLLKQLKGNGVKVLVEVDNAKPVKVGLEHLDCESWWNLITKAHLRTNSHELGGNLSSESSSDRME